MLTLNYYAPNSWTLYRDKILYLISATFSINISDVIIDTTSLLFFRTYALLKITLSINVDRLYKKQF